MTAMAISSARQPVRRPTANSAVFLDEDLASIPPDRIPDEFRKMWGFLPIVVLIPKSAIIESEARKKADANESVACLDTNPHTHSPLDGAKARFINRIGTETFVFGEVTVNVSAMETLRKGQPVALTCKQFKTLAYLIKNPRRVISRDEFLNEVWGYQCYPCTRTVDNHILQLRRKLETKPTRPKHFQTVHGAGYRFLP
jgi:hypothetical protein